MDKFRSWLGSNRHQCRVNPASWLKTSEFGLLADTCHLLSKHGMVLESDHAEKIAGRAQKNRLGQGNGHSSPDSASMRLFAVAVCNTQVAIALRCRSIKIHLSAGCRASQTNNQACRRSVCVFAADSVCCRNRGETNWLASLRITPKFAAARHK